MAKAGKGFGENGECRAIGENMKSIPSFEADALKVFQSLDSEAYRSLLEIIGFHVSKGLEDKWSVEQLVHQVLCACSETSEKLHVFVQEGQDFLKKYREIIGF